MNATILAKLTNLVAFLNGDALYLATCEAFCDWCEGLISREELAVYEAEMALRGMKI